MKSGAQRGTTARRAAESARWRCTGLNGILGADFIDRRIAYGHHRGKRGAGVYAEGSVAKRSEAFGFCGQKKCGADVLPAGLEPDLHQRTRLFCKRNEVV